MEIMTIARMYSRAAGLARTDNATRELVVLLQITGLDPTSSPLSPSWRELHAIPSNHRPFLQARDLEIVYIGYVTNLKHGSHGHGRH